MKFINWLIWSSTNPAKVSATIKGLGMYLIPVVLTVSGLTGIATPDQEGLTAILDMIATALTVLGTIVASIVTLVGVVRKIITTWQGTNAVLIAHERGEFD